MIPLDQAVVARLDSHGEKFELLVDPDLAAKYRQGEELKIEDIVAALYVFENASKAEKASEDAMMKVFQTTEFEEVADTILKKGEIHLTTEQRKEMIAKMRKQVVNLIAKNAVNPQTHLPHPPARIERAMEEARVNIDPFKHLDVQVRDTLKALRPLLPIKFEEIKVAVRIPPEYAAKSYGDISAAAVIQKQEWQKDGSWICVVVIPAGIQEDFYGLINRLTKGDGEVKIVERIS